MLACRVFVLGRKAWPLTHPAAPGIFLILLAVAFLFDGWRPLASSPETREFFPRWSQTIGELNHLTPAQVFNWTGWLLPVVPILLVLRFRKEKNRVCLALAFLVILTSALSLWYARWGYFLALVFAFSLPWALASIPKKPVVWIIFLTMPLGVAKGYHVGITMLDSLLKGAAVRAAFRLTVVLTIGLMGLVVVVSVHSVVERWGEILSTLPVPASVFFMPIVIGAVHSILHLMVQLIEGERPRRPDVAGEVS